MKKIFAAFLLTASLAYGRASVNVLEYGPPTAGTITNVLARVGTANEVALVVKGGRWNIGTNFTTPTNVFLEMEPGAFFWIQTTNVITINGNMDNNWALKFSGPGAGNVAGTYLSKVRIPQWFGTNGTALYGGAALGSGSGNTPHYIGTTNMTNIVIVFKNDADGLTNEVLNGTNFILKTPGRLFTAYKNGAQAIGTTNTHLTFSNAVYNNQELYITNGGRFVNLYTGVYQFVVSCCASGNASQMAKLTISTGHPSFVEICSQITFCDLGNSGAASQPQLRTPFLFFDQTGISVRATVELETGQTVFSTNSTYFSGYFFGN